MKAMLKQVDGLSLVGKAGSNHWITMDGAPESGGSAAGPTPMELVLLGLGGWTSMDVISILQKMRMPLDGYECHLEAERAADHPKVFTNIKVKFVFYGKGISKEAVERAIELSESKYCSVSAMLAKTAEIVTEYEIREHK